MIAGGWAAPAAMPAFPIPTLDRLERRSRIDRLRSWHRTRLRSRARRRFNGVVGANGRAVLTTPLQRALVVLGMYVTAAAVSAVLTATATIVTLRVGGFHELDPSGTAVWIAAGVFAWVLVTCLFWAARHWRGPAGLGEFLRTGRSERRQKPGRWSRAIRWTRDAATLAAVVFGVLLLRFPNEPSAPSAAVAVLVAIKVAQTAIFMLLVAVEKALVRAQRLQLSCTHEGCTVRT
jgi:hypothetical protein